MNTVCYYAQAVYDKLRGRIHPAVTPETSQWTTTSFAMSSNSVVDNDGSEDTYFQRSAPMDLLPVEILTAILNKLDVKTLKTCRLVSYQWNSVLSSNESFLDKLCYAHVESIQEEKQRDQILAYFRQSGRLPLDLTSFRLRNLFSYWTPMSVQFHQWMNCTNMFRVTWLELQSSQMCVHHVAEIVVQLVNLKTLKFSGNTAILKPRSSMEDNLPRISYLKTSASIPFSYLEHLIIHSEDAHNILNALDRVDLLTFSNLKTLDLQGNAGQITHSQQFGKLLQKLLIQNAKSLRVFRLDNFPESISGTLDSRLASSKYEVRASIYAEFPRFVNTFPWKELYSLPNIQEVSFQRFAVAQVTDSFLNENLVSLFKECGPTLKRFSIGQLYFSNDQYFEKLEKIIPKDVTCSVTSVHLYAPRPNLDNLTEVVHCEQNIIDYRRASVNLQFKNISWTINYLTWASLSQSAVMYMYGPLLRSLTLTSAVFPIGDEEFQFLIEKAPGLEELCIESTDLSTLTDSGITGLSQHAVNWIWADDKYQPITKNFIGQPIQNLKRLRKLELSWVGIEVSHVSLLQSFIKMPALQYLKICQKTLVIRPSAVENFRLNGNIFFEYVPTMEVIEDEDTTDSDEDF